MEMGEKLRQERLTLGLSQREVCGEVITRNMLSQIENGQAKPSMKTLQYLASVFQKPVGYFLGETTACINQSVMEKAKEAFARKEYQRVLLLLEEYQGPDQLYDWEAGLMGYLSCLEGARMLVEEGRQPVAEKLLNQAVQFQSPYIIGALTRLREELLTGAGGKPSGSVDEELLRRAEAAMEKGDYVRAQQFLDAVESRNKAWYTLCGTAALRLGLYAQAEENLLLGEEAACLPILEECYRMQGDFEKAYFCLQKRMTRSGTA